MSTVDLVSRFGRTIEGGSTGSGSQVCGTKKWAKREQKFLLTWEQPGNILFKKPFENPKKIEKPIVKYKKILQLPIFAKHPNVGFANLFSNEWFIVGLNIRFIIPEAYLGA